MVLYSFNSEFINTTALVWKTPRATMLIPLQEHLLEGYLVKQTQPVILYSLRSKRFRLVSEKGKIKERDFRPLPSLLLAPFSRGIWLSLLVLCSETAQKSLLRRLDFIWQLGWWSEDQINSKATRGMASPFFRTCFSHKTPATRAEVHLTCLHFLYLDRHDIKLVLFYFWRWPSRGLSASL